MDARLTDAELTECAELLEPLLSLRATALVAEVRESRAAIATLTADVGAWRSAAGHVDNFRSEARCLREQMTTLLADLATARDHLRVSEEQVEALGHMNEANVRMEKERDLLAARQQELLQTIRNLSASIPYAEEATSAAVLIAEVGTLRRRVAVLEESLDETCETCDGACPHRRDGGIK